MLRKYFYESGVYQSVHYVIQVTTLLSDSGITTIDIRVLTNGDWLADSRTVELTDQDLKETQSEKLRVARNEMISIVEEHIDRNYGLGKYIHAAFEQIHEAEEGQSTELN